MPRVERGLVDGSCYHILNRGNGKQKIFHKDQDYEAFIELMKKAKERHPIRLLGYCLMPNHFHIVVMCIKSKELSRHMQWLMTSHVRRYHAHYKSSGHVWQGRFKSFIVQKDIHLLTLLRYVERNPVRTGLVKSTKEWGWSSQREAVDRSSSLLLDELPIELPPQWEKYVDEPLTDYEINMIRQSVNRGCPYGEKSWQQEICKQLRLESTLRPRGRPRKIFKNG